MSQNDEREIAKVHREVFPQVFEKIKGEPFSWGEGSAKRISGPGYEVTFTCRGWAWEQHDGRIVEVEVKLDYDETQSPLMVIHVSVDNHRRAAFVTYNIGYWIKRLGETSIEGLLGNRIHAWIDEKNRIRDLKRVRVAPER
jgi:hypothetical protein